MEITIIGAGALGTILGAHLIVAGHDVTIVARGRRAQDVTQYGLRVRGLVELNTPCRVVEKPETIVTADLLIFAVKTYHMAEATAQLSNATPLSVFSVANGVMKNEQLAATYGADKVLGCMANISGELLDAGTVEFTRNVQLYIGHTGAYTGPDASASAGALDAAGINTEASAQIETVEWSKFVGWVALFSLSLIARTTTGRFLENPRLAALGVRLIREMAHLAAARGIGLIDQSPVPVYSIASGSERIAIEKLNQIGRDLIASVPNHRMSSLQDLEAGRTLEVEETLGYALNEAARLGIDAPTLDVCYAAAAGLNTLAKNTQ